MVVSVDGETAQRAHRCGHSSHLLNQDHQIVRCDGVKVAVGRNDGT